MFEFLLDAGNYESRKVGRNDFDWGFVSTAYCSDGEMPYETAVEHVAYNDGQMVIVENYETAEEAAEGHDRWVKTMTADDLPEKLVDCCNAGIAQLCKA